MTDPLYSAALLLGLILLASAPLVVWPSRWNVPGLMSAGFVVIAYVIPVTLLDKQYNQGEQVFQLYTHLAAIGGLSYFTGVLIGFRLRTPVLLQRQSTILLPRQSFIRLASRRVLFLSILVLLGMGATFLLMGFIPLLEPKPMEAKFLRGAYQLDTLPNVGYRLFHELATIALPLSLALWADTRRRRFAILSILLATIFVLTLVRSPLGVALLLILGLFLTKKRLTPLYLSISLAVYVLGASAYYIASLFIDSYSNFQRQDLLNIVAAGAPDVADHVGFIARYLTDPVLTYGKTFWGGLIPGRYEWNPAVWSVSVGATTDINTVTSGGLRLPGPIMAYTAFGQFSVVPIMILSGMLTGLFLNHLRQITKTEDRSYTRLMLGMLFYLNVGLFFATFYRLTYIDLISCSLLIYLSYRWSCSRHCASDALPISSTPLRT